MILTGKCKDDFNEWTAINTPYYSEDENSDFYKLHESCQNALIIEFFDSVGIYVNPFPVCLIYVSFGYVIRLKDIEIKEIESEENEYETRQEATNKAIEKANELYNEK